MPQIQLIGIDYSINQGVHDFSNFVALKLSLFVGADGLKSKPCAEEKRMTSGSYSKASNTWDTLISHHFVTSSVTQ